MSDLTIPAGWADVDAAWMAVALGRPVEAVELLLVDDGTNRRARFAVVSPSGDRSTVFLKASDLAHAELNARTGGVFNEPRLFLRDVDLPLEHPVVHLTAAGDWQRPEVSITLAERYAAAFVDLDSAAAIDELAG